MTRFVYIGPPDEPLVSGTFHAGSGEWVRGVPREIADEATAARLRKHPHWRAEGEAEQAGAASAAPVTPKRRGRPPKVRDDGGS